MTIYSQEAEEQVLGAVMINPDYIPLLALSPDDFFLLRHSIIWEAALSLDSQRVAVDAMTLTTELQRRNQLMTIGGPAVLSSLMAGCATSTNTEVYAGLIKRAAIRRRLSAYSDKLRALAGDETLSVDDILSQANTGLLELERDHSAEHETTFSDEVDKYYHHMQTLHDARSRGEQPLVGLPTGYSALDSITSGMSPTDFILLGGRPSMGKTALLVNIMLNLALGGRRVAFWSGEMSTEQVIQRAVSVHLGMNSRSIREAKLTPEEYRRFVASRDTIRSLPIYINDTTALSPVALRAKAARAQHRYGLDILMLDYVQLMRVPGIRNDANRVAEVSEISLALKSLAKDLHIPVLAAVQLNRNLEHRADKRPVLSDLRESGQLEQDADMVMFLYRDALYNEATEFPNGAEVIVAKNRNGPTGVASLYYDRNSTRFANARITEVNLNGR